MDTHPATQPPLYLLNSPILTAYGEWQFTPLDTVEARTLVAAGFTSAIGHETTAQFLSGLLQVEIPVNRISIAMQPNDAAIVLRLKQRLPEGQILRAEELQRVPYELGLLRRKS